MIWLDCLEWIGKLILFLWLAVWVGAVAVSISTQGIKAWRYVLLTIPFWVIFFARYPASVVAVLFFSTPDRLHLTRWNWLETIDNTLAGDYGHQTEHMLGSDPLAWYNRLLWLWRNGGNRFNYEVIGVSSQQRPVWAFWYQRAVLIRSDRQIFGRRIVFDTGRFLDVRIGWSDYALQGRCKFVLTIRPKTKP